MDAIDTIDWGAYAHFTFVAAQHPDLLAFVKRYYHISTYVYAIGLILPLFILFVAQRRTRTAIAASLGIVAAMGMIETCRLLVPRLRPPDAVELVGVQNMLGRYPSAGVFLFMLMMVLFGFTLWPWLRNSISRVLFVTVAATLTVALAMLQFLLALQFVSDVVGGLVGATIIALFIGMFLNPAPVSLNTPSN